MRALPVVLALPVVVLIGGCQSAPSSLTATLAAPIGIGENLLGEECRLQRARGQAVQRDQGRQAGLEQYEIYCGSWEQPSARLTRTTVAAAPEQLAVDGRWREQIETFATCEAPAPASILGDVPALSLPCATRRGGWPYDALVARIDEAAYLGDSIPASRPALERAIGVLAGRSQPANLATAKGATAKGADGRAGALYSAGDLEGFRLLLRRAQYFNYQGEHAEAERLYREALGLQRSRLASNHAGLAFVLMHLALELSNQERFSEAEPLFAQAEEAVRYSFDAAEEARLLSYRAIDYANQQRFQKAMQTARDASALRRDLAAGSMSVAAGSSGLDPRAFVTAGGAAAASGKLSVSLGGLGETALGDMVQSKYIEAAMLVRQGNLDAAATAAEEAIGILDQEPRMPRRWMPQIRGLQAAIDERRGNLPAAEALLTESINGYRALAIGSRNEALDLLALGRIQATQGHSEAALQAFRAAFAILEEGKHGVRFDDAMAYFDAALAEARRSPAQRSQIHTEMFQVSQLARSSRAAQSIGLASARLAGSDREVGGLIRQLQDARRKRDAANEALSQARANPAALGPQLDELEKNTRDLDAEVADLERHVQAAAPRYQHILDAPVPVDDLTGALRPGEALWQIVVGPKRSIGFLIDADGIEAYAIDLGEQDLQRFVARLRAPFDEAVGAPYDVPAAAELYRRLAGPVEPRLARARHVIVVPTGPLQALPFGVLVSEPPQPGGTQPGGTHDYSQVAWVARRNALTTAPSVQSFVRLRSVAQPSRASRSMIGFGDFVPARSVDAILKSRGLSDGCRPQAQALAALAPLPNTAAELRAVQASFPDGTGTLRLGRDFTRAGVRAQPLSQYRIVYFATHAMLPHELECWSEPMLLASADARQASTEGGDADDGLITASDIMDLELDADLVVLSACNTADADGHVSGDSLSGLARAFFYAGARSLLVTHWPIPDEPTKELMTRLFARASDDAASTAEALRQAQSAMIGTPRFSHPLAWGAFTVIGDGGRPIRGAPPSS